MVVLNIVLKIIQHWKLEFIDNCEFLGINVVHWIEGLLIGQHHHMCLECPEMLVVLMQVLKCMNCSSDVYLVANGYLVEL